MPSLAQQQSCVNADRVFGCIPMETPGRKWPVELNLTSQLIERAKNEGIDVKKQVMLEDGLEDVENLLADLNKDSIGAKYLKMSNSVSFSDSCSCVIELPVSEHWRPEVKLAKKNKIKNLTSYTLKEVNDEG